MRRELAIALRSRATWVVAALAALLVGHGFILAVDLFSSASRSALGGALQAREMDPLSGIVRPTLGGVDLALALLAPIVAARVVSVEKERGTFDALCLQVGSTTRVLLRKAAAAACASALLVLPAPLCLAGYAAVGGHIDATETAVALLGAALHLAVVVAGAIAAASWTKTFAQAAAIAVAVSLTSWMIDAGEGFAALAWLGPAESWSIERQVAPFEGGLVATGPLVALLVATALAIGLALVGGRIDLTLRRRAVIGVVVGVVGLGLVGGALRDRRAYDWTEQRRRSLPPDVVAALREIRAPIVIEARLDRDDSRRRQLEADVVTKLLLARPDLIVTFPLDARREIAAAGHDDDYGRIVVRVRDEAKGTRSTSRKELVTLVLEAAGARTPDWTMPSYDGHPFVVEGKARSALLALAYGFFPLALLGTGIALSRRRMGR